MITLKIEIRYDLIKHGSMVRLLYSILKILQKVKGPLIIINMESDETKQNIRPITTPYIRERVCRILRVPIEALDSQTRKREIVEARQISMFFSKKLTKDSLASIGQDIGDKDHATVLHACKTINNLMETNKAYREKIDTIGRNI